MIQGYTYCQRFHSEGCSWLQIYLFSCLKKGLTKNYYGNGVSLWVRVTLNGCESDLFEKLDGKNYMDQLVGFLVERKGHSV